MTALLIIKILFYYFHKLIEGPHNNILIPGASYCVSPIVLVWGQFAFGGLQLDTQCSVAMSRLEQYQVGDTRHHTHGFKFSPGYCVASLSVGWMEQQ